MRKFLVAVPFLIFLMLNLSGCSTVGDKNGSLSVIYIITAFFSLLLLIGCTLLVRKKRFWFITLFSSVLIINIGYSLLSVSTELQMALWANRIAYLGSVFLSPTMFMIILNVTNTPHKKMLPYILFTAAFFMFLISASPGILPIYYKEVSFEIVNGVSKLIKVYGPLHLIYFFYLLGYFSAMLAIIIRANIKKTIHTTVHAVIITIAVFVNIGVWLIEQFVSIDFEMLSVSYIISELFILGVHLVMNEYQRMSQIIKQVEKVRGYSGEDQLAKTMLEQPVITETVSPERISAFMKGIETLTATEKSIYEAHLARMTSKEIMASMNIKESTLKYHNRNLYGKLEVSSRKELLELNKHIKVVKETLENVDKTL